jgi:hypothetical protein
MSVMYYIIMDDTTKLTVYVPTGVHYRLKVEAARRKQSMSSAIIEALAIWIKSPRKDRDGDAQENA